MSAFSSAKGPTSSAGLLGLPVDDQFETFRAAVHLAVEQRELFAQAPPQARQVGCRHLGRSQVAEAEAGQVGAEQLAEDHPAGPGRQVDAQGLRGLIRHRLVPQAVALGGDRRCQSPTTTRCSRNQW